MINFRSLKIKPQLQQDRLNRVIPILGEDVVRRLLCFALYLLGVDRPMISDVMAVSPESLRTFIRGVKKRGLPGLEDHRHRSSSFLRVQVQSSPSPTFEIIQNNHGVVIPEQRPKLNQSLFNNLLPILLTEVRLQEKPSPKN